MCEEGLEEALVEYGAHGEDWEGGPKPEKVLTGYAGCNDSS